MQSEVMNYSRVKVPRQLRLTWTVITEITKGERYESHVRRSLQRRGMGRSQ